MAEEYESLPKPYVPESDHNSSAARKPLYRASPVVAFEIGQVHDWRRGLKNSVSALRPSLGRFSSRALDRGLVSVRLDLSPPTLQPRIIDCS